jgi:hypothetical protein
VVRNIRGRNFAAIGAKIDTTIYTIPGVSLRILKIPIMFLLIWTKVLLIVRFAEAIDRSLELLELTT